DRLGVLSFPTRRASDLWLRIAWRDLGRWRSPLMPSCVQAMAGAAAAAVATIRVRRSPPWLRIRTEIMFSVSSPLLLSITRAHVRSEEHTSELQSRENIV